MGVNIEGDMPLGRFCREKPFRIRTICTHLMVTKRPNPSHFVGIHLIYIYIYKRNSSIYSSTAETDAIGSHGQVVMRSSFPLPAIIAVPTTSTFSEKHAFI